MSGDRLAEIRARLDAATPGPWTPHRDWLPGIRVMQKREGERDWPTVATCGFSGDSDLIAHAPDDIAYLLDEVEAARASAERYRTQLVNMGRFDA